MRESVRSVWESVGCVLEFSHSATMQGSLSWRVEHVGRSRGRGVGVAIHRPRAGTRSVVGGKSWHIKFVKETNSVSKIVIRFKVHI